MRPIQLNGHIGAGVSALVDGQLSPEEEERAWSHVLGCPGCRRRVEAEGWTKTQLRTFGPAPRTAPDSLVGALYDVEAWAQVDEIERASRRRFTATALVGAGTLGAAVLGIFALTSPPAGLGEVPGTPSPATIHSEQVGSMVGVGVGASLLTAHVHQRRAEAKRAHARHAGRTGPAATPTAKPSRHPMVPAGALAGSTAR